jgi:hypothetical protein
MDKLEREKSIINGELYHLNVEGIVSIKYFDKNTV